MDIALRRKGRFKMRMSSVVLLLVVAGIAAYAQTVSPRMTSVEPMNGKAGDVIAVSGENLTKDNVAKVYLTDGKNDLLCEVREQTATVLKIVVPAKASGKMSLMILTAEKEPKFVEQPVKVTIEAPQ